ncbi:protein kibra [Trichonephila clavipes]|nr:protein kibra [Trichonephila clavipes]
MGSGDLVLARGKEETKLTHPSFAPSGKRVHHVHFGIQRGRHRREKMAFFTRVNMTVPLLPAEFSTDTNQAKKENTHLRPPQSQSGDKNCQQRFEYVVDPELGVQV